MKLKYKFKHFIYLLEIMLIFVFQHNSLFSLGILGFKPILLIPAFVSICMFINKKEAVCYGFLTGLLLDMEMGNVFGTHILLLLIFSYIIGFLFEHIIKSSMINAILASCAVAFMVVGVRFILFYVFKGYGDNLYAFTNHYLPSLIHTVIVAPVFYLFNRGIIYFVCEKEGV